MCRSVSLQIVPVALALALQAAPNVPQLFFKPTAVSTTS